MHNTPAARPDSVFGGFICNAWRHVTHRYKISMM